MWKVTDRMLQAYFDAKADSKGLSPRNDIYNRYRFGLNLSQYRKIDRAMLRYRLTGDIPTIQELNDIIRGMGEE